MAEYRITNRVTGERCDVEAPFAQDACELLGWLIGECHVELRREGPYSRLIPPPRLENPGGERGNHLHGDR